MDNLDFRLLFIHKEVTYFLVENFEMSQIFSEHYPTYQGDKKNNFSFYGLREIIAMFIVEPFLVAVFFIMGFLENSGKSLQSLHIYQDILCPLDHATSTET